VLKNAKDIFDGEISTQSPRNHQGKTFDAIFLALGAVLYRHNQRIIIASIPGP
jgi:hypothetical protein